MNPDHFELTHSDVPKPLLFDQDVEFRAWPMPPVKPWAPRQPREVDLDFWILGVALPVLLAMLAWWLA